MKWMTLKAMGILREGPASPLTNIVQHNGEGRAREALEVEVKKHFGNKQAKALPNRNKYNANSFFTSPISLSKL